MENNREMSSFETFLFSAMANDNSRFLKENKKLKKQRDILAILAIPSIIRISLSIGEWINKKFILNEPTIIETEETEEEY